jgi:hypothetical protein
MVGSSWFGSDSPTNLRGGSELLDEGLICQWDEAACPTLRWSPLHILQVSLTLIAPVGIVVYRIQGTLQTPLNLRPVAELLNAPLRVAGMLPGDLDQGLAFVPAEGHLFNRIERLRPELFNALLGAAGEAAVNIVKRGGPGVLHGLAHVLYKRLRLLRTSSVLAPKDPSTALKDSVRGDARHSVVSPLIGGLVCAPKNFLQLFVGDLPVADLPVGEQVV